MPRGGYRPGAGRPRGAKNKKPAKNNNKNKIETENNTETENSIEVSGEIEKQAEHYGITPLEYMLQVINDPKADVDLKARLAIAAAPFVHRKKQEFKMGKKDEQSEKAKKAGSGRFAKGNAPLQMVK